MFNPTLDHTCACHKYYPPEPNFTGLDFDLSDFDSLSSISSDSSDSYNYSESDSSSFSVPQSAGKQVSQWISLLVGAPFNIIILIVTLSNWQRKSSSSALFVVHLCIGMAPKNTAEKNQQNMKNGFVVHYASIISFSEFFWTP